MGDGGNQTDWSWLLLLWKEVVYGRRRGRRMNGGWEWEF
jgi:hypothetical protein